MSWERPERGARSSVLEPDQSRCLVCGCGRPISPAFAPSRRSGQECDFFSQVVHYDPRGARILRMVSWGDCGDCCAQTDTLRRICSTALQVGE